MVEVEEDSDTHLMTVLDALEAKQVVLPADNDLDQVKEHDSGSLVGKVAHVLPIDQVVDMTLGACSDLRSPVGRAEDRGQVAS